MGISTGRVNTFYPKNIVEFLPEHLKYRQRSTKFLQTCVPIHVVSLTQIATSVYLGQTHLGAPFQASAWVRKFSLGSTGDDRFFGKVSSFESDIPE